MTSGAVDSAAYFNGGLHLLWADVVFFHHLGAKFWCFGILLVSESLTTTCHILVALERGRVFSCFILFLQQFGPLQFRHVVLVKLIRADPGDCCRNLNDFELADVHKKAFDAQKKSEGAQSGNQNAKKQLVETDQLFAEAKKAHAGETATILAKDFGITTGQFKHSVRIGNAMEEAERLIYYTGIKRDLHYHIRFDTVKVYKTSCKQATGDFV